MPKHVHSSQYLGNPYNILPSVVLHPDIQPTPAPDTERYLLPAVFTLKHGDKFTIKYPGPGVYYIYEGELEVEDTKHPGHVTKLVAGSVLHVEEGEMLRWFSPSTAKGFGVFWVPVSVKGFEVFIVPE